MNSTVEMGSVIEILPSTPSPVQHYLELAFNGDLAAFQAEVRKHPLGVTAGPDAYEDRSPLHMAALGGRLEIVKLIMASPEISAHVVNARDRFGYTPLHLAVRSEHEDVVRTFSEFSLTLFLSASSSEPDEEGQDCDGFTPLHVAAAKGNVSIVKLLLQLLASQERPLLIHTTTWQGTTALDIAKRRKHTKLVDLLECWDVKWLQSERQKSANSVNAILVGAALVATVTFQCLSQPPGYTFASEGALAAAIRLQWFLVCTAFSFAFAIVSLITGTTAVIPSTGASLKKEVQQLRRSVVWASSFLFLAIFCLVWAFQIGGFVVTSFIRTGRTVSTVLFVVLLCLPILVLAFVLRHIVLPKVKVAVNKWAVRLFLLVAVGFNVGIYVGILAIESKDIKYYWERSGHAWAQYPTSEILG